MGRYTPEQFKHVRFGHRPVHQWQLSSNKVQPEHLANARLRTFVVLANQWTADTTGYPDATALGNVTLYHTAMQHGLRNAHAVVVALTDTVGLDVSARIQFAMNQDPSNPGTADLNWTRIWISSDAAPSALMYITILA